jgi:RNA polymerase sigma factor (sigma-70 family)
MAATQTGLDAARELDELYREHAAEVYRYVFAVLGDSADAEDITQTTFVNALRALERGDRPRKPTNWLITIAHNLIRQRFRQQAARPREVELDRDVPAAEAGDDGPSIDELVRALQRIPAQQREALVLREMEGRSYKEISEILGVSQAALETRIFRARRSLAEVLENLDTCDRAELALSQSADGRLGRRERKRLVEHLETCPSCARVVVLGMRRRRSFKAFALVPLPLSLTLFKGAPSASAAAGTAAGVAGTAAGVGATGVTAKIAIGFAAVAVASGAGYEGVKAVHDPATPPRPAKAAPAALVPAARPPALHTPPGLAQQTPGTASVKAPQARTPVKGRSASAPGHTKALPAQTGAPTPKAAPQAHRPRTQGPPAQRPQAKQPRAKQAPPDRSARSTPATSRGKSPATRGASRPKVTPKPVVRAPKAANEGRASQGATRPAHPAPPSG